jgi:hypothetical protein
VEGNVAAIELPGGLQGLPPFRHQDPPFSPYRVHQGHGDPAGLPHPLGHPEEGEAPFLQGQGQGRPRHPGPHQEDAARAPRHAQPLKPVAFPLLPAEPPGRQALQEVPGRLLGEERG